MPKASITLKDGARVTIEGTTKQVGDLLVKFGNPNAAAAKSGGRSRASAAPGRSRNPSNSGPQALIAELIDDGFFRTQRSISEIQAKLRERGYIYEQPALSAPLLRLTKMKKLRRIKEKKGWAYSA
jgi:hypothetical protein